MTTAIQKQNEKIDYEFNLQSHFGFFGHQLTSGYRITNGVLLRIKDHKANYAYFRDDIENNPYIKKIVSVNLADSDCRNITATSFDEIKSEYPNFEIVEINFDYENTDIETAINLIKKHL